MTQITLEDILKGWRSAGAEKPESKLLGGYPVPDVDILIDDGTEVRLPDQRSPIGESRMVWVTPDSLRPGPYGRTAIATSRARFSGANRHRRGTIRSVALFYHFRNNPEKLEFACILTALVGVRNTHKKLFDATEDAVKACLKELDFKCLQDIWARANSSPMPSTLPASIRKLTKKTAGNGALGRALRHWHEITFQRLVPVNATPVRGGLGALTLADFDDVAERYATGLNKGHGEEEWKCLNRSGLEALVWSEPRSQLSVRLGVSDVAIAKRCKRENILFPPRGYWQRLDAEIDPRPILEKNGVEPPASVAKELAHRFDI